MIIHRQTDHRYELPTTTGVPGHSPTVLYTSPSQVLVEISTTVLISDYSRYYHQPIESFTPVYRVLPDGSFVAPPLTSDLDEVHIILILTGALCAFFLMNIITIIRFIRRGKVKNKTLFYLLLASQVTGPLAYLPFIVSVFSQSTNCYATVTLYATFTFISFTLLITGIFGTKAYRCLNNSKVVICVLSFLKCVSFVLYVWDRCTLTTRRRLSGSCARSSGGGIMIGQSVEQLVELLFISCCFLYALRKFHKVPSTRGRLTISVRTDSVPTLSRRVSEQGERRGWWDYAPTKSSPEREIREQDAPSVGILEKIRKAWSKTCPMSEVAIAPQRKPSLHTEYPIPQPPQSIPSPRPQTIAPILCPLQTARERLLFLRSLSPLQLMADVLRNELAYSAVITLVQTFVSVASIVGTYKGSGMAAYGWSLLNWVLLSFTTLHSFQRVVKRHDREAFLQQPAIWDPIHRAERAMLDGLREDRIRRVRSSASNLRTTRRSVSTSGLHVSQDLLYGSNLAPTQSRCSGSSCSLSIHADDLGPAVPWMPPALQIAPSFLDTQSSGEAHTTLSCESALQHTPLVHRTSDDGSDTLHTLVKREGWEPPDVR